MFQYPLYRIVLRFNAIDISSGTQAVFQYPLYRIVLRFGGPLYTAYRWPEFQYPLYRIVLRFEDLAPSQRARIGSFSIRSIGSF